MITRKNTEKDEESLKVRFPINITLRDLITIATVIITITLAWGVFSTRLTLVEREVVSGNAIVAAHREEDRIILKDLQTRLLKIEHQINENEIFIDELYARAKLPPPKHKYSN